MIQFNIFSVFIFVCNFVWILRVCVSDVLKYVVFNVIFVTFIQSKTLPEVNVFDFKLRSGFLNRRTLNGSYYISSTHWELRPFELSDVPFFWLR